LLHFAALTLTLFGLTDSAVYGQGSGRPAYVFGPGDQLSIRIPEVEELHDKPMRIDEAGDINLALLGRLHASGLTVSQLETALNEKLKKLVIQPAAVVTIMEMKSQPVAVAGMVRSPGIVQLQGSKSLLEVLSLAGGLAPEAGYRIQITRHVESGPLPIEGSHADATGKYLVGDITYKGLLDGTNPGGNIQIVADDLITVPKAAIVYVIGDVHRPGGFALADNETVSALQALAMAEGTLVTAAPRRASIKRMGKDNQRVEIAVDLAKVMDSKAADINLLPNDILIIPSSAAKRASTRVLETLLQLGTGIAIYRR
jgi:polysaccharide export outer membrane protein